MRIKKTNELLMGSCKLQVKISIYRFSCLQDYKLKLPVQSLILKFGKFQFKA